MIEPINPIPWEIYDIAGNISIESFESYEDSCVCQDLYREDAEYLVQACNNFPKSVQLLNQITEDLTALQSHPDDLSHDQLMVFYDRMCANVTNIEEFLKEIES